MGEELFSRHRSEEPIRGGGLEPSLVQGCKRALVLERHTYGGWLRCRPAILVSIPAQFRIALGVKHCGIFRPLPLAIAQSQPVSVVDTAMCRASSPTPLPSQPFRAA